MWLPEDRMSIHHLDRGGNDDDGDDGGDDRGDNDDDGGGDGGLDRTNCCQVNSYTMTDESMMMMMMRTTNLMMSCHSIHKFVEYDNVSL